MKPKKIGTLAGLLIILGGLAYVYKIETAINDSSRERRTASNAVAPTPAPGPARTFPAPAGFETVPLVPDASPTPTPEPTPNPYDSAPQARATVVVKWADSGEPVVGAAIALKGFVASRSIDWTRTYAADAQGKISLQFPEAFDLLLVDLSAPKAGRVMKIYNRRSDTADALAASSTTPFADPLTISMEHGARIFGVVRRADNGRPVPGARVVAYTDGKGAGAPAVAGPDGGFSIDAQSPGSVHLEASGPGVFSSPASQSVRVAANAGGQTGPISVSVQPTATLSGFVTRLEDGAPIAGAKVRLDVADEQLAIEIETGANGSYVLRNIPAGYPLRFVATHPGNAGAVVSLTLTPSAAAQSNFKLPPGGRLEATVKDTANAPVAGASILAPGARGMGLEPLAVTDAHGHAVVENLDMSKPVQYTVMKPGYTFSGGSQTVPFDAGHVARADVVLKPESTATVSFAGRALDRDGKPLAGVRVAYAPVYMYSRPPEGGVTTGADGSYRLGPVAYVDQGMLAASATSMALRLVSPPAPPATGQTVAVDFPMEKASPVAGRILAESGAPVASAVVTLVSFGDPPPRGSQLSLLERAGLRAKTDAQGRFVFLDLPDAEWNLQAEAAGYATASSHDGFPSGSDFVLKGNGWIRGRVLDAETHQPIRQYRIAYKAYDQSASSPPQWKKVEDPDGKFAIAGADQVHAGTLTVDRDGFAQLVRRDVLGGAATAPELTLEMHRGKALRIDVTDKSTGAPIQGAAILAGQLSPNAPRQMLPPPDGDSPGGLRNPANYQTDASGMAVISEGDLPLTVRVRAPGRVSVVIPPSDRLQYGGIAGELKVAMAPGATLAGGVQLEGKPAAGLELSLETDPPTLRIPSRIAKTDAAGRYAFDRLSAGTYLLGASRQVPGFAPIYPFERRIQLAEGQAMTLDVGQDGGPGALFGVVSKNGQPQPDIAVELTPAFASDYQRLAAATGPDGVYKIFGLAPGGYNVSIRPMAPQGGIPSGPPLNDTVQVAGGALERDFDLSGEVHAVTLRLKYPDDYPENRIGEVSGGTLTPAGAIQGASGQPNPGLLSGSVPGRGGRGGAMTFRGRLKGDYRLTLRGRNPRQIAVSRSGPLGAGLMAENEIEFARVFPINNLQADVDLGELTVPVGRAHLILSWPGQSAPRPPKMFLFQSPAGTPQVSRFISFPADPGKDDQIVSGIQMGPREYRLSAPGYSVDPPVINAAAGDGAVPDLAFALKPITLIEGVVVAAPDAASRGSARPVTPSRITLSGPGTLDLSAVQASQTVEGLMDLTFGDTGAVLTGSYFSIRGVPEGDYTLRVEADGLQLSETRVQAKSGVPFHASVAMQH